METNLNEKKYYNYKIQSQRLKRAMDNGFYLEAIFIEYAILEDRTEAVLRYEGNTINGERYVTINRKLNKIRKLSSGQKTLINRYFSPELIDEIIVWKDKRNPMIHAMMKQHLTTEGLRELAEEGLQLVKTMNRLSTNYKRAVERQKSKEGKQIIKNTKEGNLK